MRRLKEEPFNESEDTTHGIEIREKDKGVRSGVAAYGQEDFREVGTRNGGGKYSIQQSREYIKTLASVVSKLVTILKYTTP